MYSRRPTQRFTFYISSKVLLKGRENKEKLVREQMFTASTMQVRTGSNLFHEHSTALNVTVDGEMGDVILSFITKIVMQFSEKHFEAFHGVNNRTCSVFFFTSDIWLLYFL